MGAILKNLFFLVTFGVILWFGYQLFVGSDEMMLVESGNSEAAIAERNFINQLNELRDLKIQADIFSDAEFLSLTDKRVDVIDEDAGRKNPFAPVPGLRKSEPANR